MEQVGAEWRDHSLSRTSSVLGHGELSVKLAVVPILAIANLFGGMVDVNSWSRGGSGRSCARGARPFVNAVWYRIPRFPASIQK